MSSHGEQLLLIEDDATLRRLITGRLQKSGYEIEGVDTWKRAQKAMETIHPSLILLDIRLPDTDGLKILPQLSEIAPVVVITAFGSVNDAVRAIKAGAIEYLIKPVNPETLEAVIERALETKTLRRNYAFLKDEARRNTPGLVGCSEGIDRVREEIEMLAPSDATVLILGESGVGKELVARAVHDASPRANANFIAVDCATLQETLFESEIFGHERGAFTGADRMKEGLIEVGNGGTIFLDEVGELPSSQQAKLLRVLETGRFRRVGGARDIACDVRFVAATNRDLHAMSKDGDFRIDLYYRLSALMLKVPPLRERREDVVDIAEFFIANRSFDRQTPKRLGADAKAVLQTYDWPGNARELRNVIERALLAARDTEEIRPEHLGLGLSAASTDPAAMVELRFDHEPTLEELRDRYIALIARRRDGRRAAIAETLGVSERNVYRMMKGPGGGKNGETPAR